LPENRPPCIDNRKVQRSVNAALEISGSRSYDPDYDPLGYSWEIIDRPVGSAAEISQDNLKTILFTPDIVGRYDINLIVNDGDLSSTPCKIAVTATVATELVDKETMSGIHVYPNPTRSEVNLELFLEKSAEALLSVTDIHGHVVVDQYFIHPGGGAYIMKLNFKDLNLKEGIYFLRIQSAEFAVVRKIIYI
jgi:hypothetical protein